MNRQEQTEYDLGWDFALYGRPIPDYAPAIFCDGFRAFQHGKKRARKKPSLYVRKWLQIRWGALRRGKGFDKRVTPVLLEIISSGVTSCPVTLEPLTFGELAPTDWSVERADNRFGYEPGNLIIISTRANKAKSDLSLDDIEAIANGEAENNELSREEWWRLLEMIRPLQYSNGVPSGTMVMVGQPVAPGTPLLPIARLQDMIGLATLQSFDPPQREGCLQVLGYLEELLCHSKSARRAFKKLIIAASNRARSTGDAGEIWGAIRVQRALLAFVKTQGSDLKDVYLRLAKAMDKVDAVFFPDALAVTEAYREKRADENGEG